MLARLFIRMCVQDTYIFNHSSISMRKMKTFFFQIATRIRCCILYYVNSIFFSLFFCFILQQQPTTFFIFFSIAYNETNECGLCGKVHVKILCSFAQYIYLICYSLFHYLFLYIQIIKSHTHCTARCARCTHM